MKASRARERIEEMYVLHYERLLRFAYLLTAGRGAEDLVQEAFAKAIERWDHDAAPEAFGAWAQTTLLRLHLNGVRRARRETVALARIGGRRQHDAHSADPQPEIVAALRELPPRQRAAVVLRYFEDLSEAEVAERMGCRLGTAKALLSQARGRLQAHSLLAAT